MPKYNNTTNEPFQKKINQLIKSNVNMCVLIFPSQNANRCIFCPPPWWLKLHKKYRIDAN